MIDVGEPGPAAEGDAWDKVGRTRFLWFGASPTPGDVDRLAMGDLFFEGVAPDRYDCEEFRAIYEQVVAKWEPGDDERLWSRRYLPLTPETCRMLLLDDDRTAFGIRRSFAEIPEPTVLPRDAEDDASVVLRTVRAKFAALLNADAEPSVVGFLGAEVRGPRRVPHDVGHRPAPPLAGVQGPHAAVTLTRTRHLSVDRPD